MMTDIRYFKRFRMERELTGPLPPVRALPADCVWLAWDDALVDAHARTKFASFRGEIDAEVFPSLSTPTGCVQLMRAIRQKPGFLPGATWLVAGSPRAEWLGCDSEPGRHCRSPRHWPG